jgi:hypothetical protein
MGGLCTVSMNRALTWINSPARHFHIADAKTGKPPTSHEAGGFPETQP